MTEQEMIMLSKKIASLFHFDIFDEPVAFLDIESGELVPVREDTRKHVQCLIQVVIEDTL